MVPGSLFYRFVVSFCIDDMYTKMKSQFLLVAGTSLLLRTTLALSSRDSAPTVTVANGTYIGKSVPEWQQDHFLGMPYATPPLASLRFARPRSLNSSFNRTQDATRYGYSCYQYGTTFNLSEDCLNLNGK